MHFLWIYYECCLNRNDENMKNNNFQNKKKSLSIWLIGLALPSSCFPFHPSFCQHQIWWGNPFICLFIIWSLLWNMRISRVFTVKKINLFCSNTYRNDSFCQMIASARNQNSEHLFCLSNKSLRYSPIIYQWYWKLLFPSEIFHKTANNFRCGHWKI